MICSSAVPARCYLTYNGGALLPIFPEIKQCMRCFAFHL
jgi:hypothetical protein